MRPEPAATEFESSTPALRRGRVGLVLAGAAVLVVGLAAVGVTAFEARTQRGADTPLAAAEQLVEAVADDSWVEAAMLLPPDEIDWVREVAEDVTDRLDVGRTTFADSFDLRATFGEPQPLTDGVAAVPIEEVTVEALDGPLVEAFGMRPGARETEDLRGQPNAQVVAVERDGRWFVSPLGTALEAASRTDGFGGASAPQARQGADSPEAAVGEVVRHLSVGAMGDAAHYLDPDEFQVLDHYHDYLAFVAPPPTVADLRLRLVSETEGSTVVVNAVEDEDSGDSLDLRHWCFHESGYPPDCAVDELRSMATPWTRAAWEPLLDSSPPTVRVATVERDGRHYVSLSGTVSDTVGRALARLDDHALAGALTATEWSPHAVAHQGGPGAITTVELHDGWNALTFEEQEGQFLHACAADGPTTLDQTTVDGYPVVVERIGDSFEYGTPARGLLIGLDGAPSGTSATVEVRVEDLGAGSC